MRIRREKDFTSFFNEQTGEYMRTGIMKDGVDTGEEPFMTSFPELLDVGIMGHCTHGRTGLCVAAGVQCYQDGLHADAPNMRLEDFKQIVEECRGKTFQIALGGCGDPDQHEDFEEILKLCRENGIVPNFTTSGFGLTEELAAVCSRYCGAVAVSWYRSEYTQRAIALLRKAGCKTNIHYVLSRSTMPEIMTIMERGLFPEGINAVIFLLHKPVGLGTTEEMITKDDPVFWKWLDIIDGQQFPYKIGFDSCSVPALIHMKQADPDSLDTCEGARWSAYISADMKMMPCSFDNQLKRWAVDLRKHSIREAWEGSEFEEFRDHFRTSCPECGNRKECMGGCPIVPEIVLCRH